MNLALRKPRTQKEFARWAERQDQRHEFDGVQPVAITDGSIDHNQTSLNAHVALRARLSGSCRPLGPDVGVATIGDAIRYPDALVTCSKVVDNAQTVPDVLVVFKVVSAGSSRTDRIDKVREYHAVPSIRRYVIIEQASIAMTVHARVGGGPRRVEVLTEGDLLRLPGLGVEIPIMEFHQNVELAEVDDRSAS